MLVSPAVVAVVMSLGSPYFSGTDVGDSFGVSNEVGKKIINAASTHRGVMTGKLWKIFIHTALGNDVPEECPKFPKAPAAPASEEDTAKYKAARLAVTAAKKVWLDTYKHFEADDRLVRGCLSLAWAL